MHTIHPTPTDYGSLVALIKASTTQRMRKLLILWTLSGFLIAAAGAGMFISLMNTPSTPESTRDRRESLIEQLAVARAEQQEFALQVEKTRALLANLREVKGPTELQSERFRTANSAWLIVRQSKNLKIRQKKLAGDADKVFTAWRREIKEYKSGPERQALVTHYKQVRRHLNFSLKHQNDLLQAAQKSSHALTKIALELEDSSLSGVNLSRYTLPKIDDGLKIASKQVWQSIASIDRFRRSAQTIASLRQPR